MKSPKQPDNVRHQQQADRGLSRVGGAASEGSERIAPDKGSRYVDSISRELLTDDPDPNVIAPGYADSGAFADSNAVHEVYGREGQLPDPKAIRHSDASVHTEAWTPKGRIDQWPDSSSASGGQWAKRPRKG